MEISKNLKRFLQENRELLADGEILELYKKIPNSVIMGQGGKLTDLFLDSGIDIWEYFKEGIPTGAFTGSAIKDLEIPDNITSIGNRAFYDCRSLTSVTMSNGITNIGPSAFEYCKRLTSVTMSSGVTNISYGMFAYCSSLTGITIPNNVKSIGYSAFSNCSSLTSVTVGNSVTSIGLEAFYNCSSLTSITIPDSVMNIGDNAFYNCDSLMSVTYRGTRERWMKNVIFRSASWNMGSSIKMIKCVDGDIDL